MLWDNLTRLKSLPFSKTLQSYMSLESGHYGLPMFFCPSFLPPSLSLFAQVPLNSVVDIILGSTGNPSQSHRGHPYHIHGFTFWVMDVYFPNQTGLNRTAALPPTVLRLENDPFVKCHNPPICGEIRWRSGAPPPITSPRPIRKDSVSVPTGGWVWIRLRADNPGWWFSHCHVGLHNLAGMAAILYVGTESQQPTAPGNFPKCHSFTGSQPMATTMSVPTASSGSHRSSARPLIMYCMILLMAWKAVQWISLQHRTQFP